VPSRPAGWSLDRGGHRSALFTLSHNREGRAESALLTYGLKIKARRRSGLCPLGPVQHATPLPAAPARHRRPPAAAPLGRRPTCEDGRAASSPTPRSRRLTRNIKPGSAASEPIGSGDGFRGLLEQHRPAWIEIIRRQTEPGPPSPVSAAPLPLPLRPERPPLAVSLAGRALTARSALDIVKRRAVGRFAAGIGHYLGCHSCRATGIPTYLVHGGTLERATAIAGHASTRTTQPTRADRARGDRAGGILEKPRILQPEGRRIQLDLITPAS
jgi:hypothetical protein